MKATENNSLLSLAVKVCQVYYALHTSLKCDELGIQRAFAQLHALYCFGTRPILTPFSYTVIYGTLPSFSQLYIFGDKNDIRSLQDLAKKKFEEYVPAAYNDPSFVSMLRAVYEGPDDVLKDPIIKVVKAHIDELLAKQEFIDLCENIGVLSLDVLKASKLSSGKPTSGRLVLMPKFGTH